MDKYAAEKALHEKAHAAGMAAGTTCMPTAMIVAQHANMLDDSSPVVKKDYVSEGVCGFAWVVVTPGNSKFAKFLKEVHDCKPDYYMGGKVWWVPGFGQSMTRKLEYANAYSAVLQAAGVESMSNSRMD